MGAVGPVDTVSAQPAPLHSRIDRAVADAHIGPVAPAADDAEFLRRVSLDLVGVIPTADDARAFLADESPDKRANLIDRLLDSPAYVRHMTSVFDLMLMERRGDKHVKSPEWQQYLQASIEQNKPFNQLAAEMLSTDGADPKLRPAAKFLLDRDVEPNLLTREVGRMFFGVDLECAQCHDHPLIDDYLQSDYYGLYAFVSRTYLFQPDNKKPAILAEKAEGDVKFKSVFTGFEGATRPRLPGSEEIAEPSFNKGEEYQVKADPKNKAVRPIPKYSRRAQLAPRATDGSNRAFNRNIANRLWAHMMGRGLVHPVDLHYDANPPSHPQLLEMLADEFVAMQFDVKAFLRELALTETYQRSFEMPDDLNPHVAIAVTQLPAMEAAVQQQKEANAAVGAEVKLLSEEVAAATKTWDEASAESGRANAVLAAAQKQMNDATKAQSDAAVLVTAKQQVAEPLAAAVAQIQAAQKAAPADKELADVAARLAARSTAVSAELAAAAKTLEQKQQETDTAKQQLAEAMKAAAAPTAAANTAQMQLKELQNRLKDKEASGRNAARLVMSAESQLDHAKLLKAYGDAETTLAATDASVAKVTDELKSMQAGMQQAAESLAQRAAELLAVQKVEAEAKAALAKAGEELTARQQIAGLLADSLAKAEAAGEKLPEDPDLAVAIEKLKSRTGQLNQETAELQKLVDARTAEEKAAADKLAAVTQAIAAAEKMVADIKAQIAATDARLKEATGRRSGEQSAVDASFEELTTHWAHHFAVTPLEPLSPEQIAWSILQSTGQLERQRAASAAEFEKKTPLTEEDRKDPANVAARDAAVEAAAVAKLQGNVNLFVQLFGAGAGQPQHQFFATVDQSLFFANGGQIRAWLAPGGGNVTDRMLQAEEAKSVAEELYLSVLTRLPTAEESADVAAYLESKKEKKSEAVQELAWALLTSSEFRFNH